MMKRSSSTEAAGTAAAVAVAGRAILEALLRAPEQTGAVENARDLIDAMAGLIGTGRHAFHALLLACGRDATSAGHGLRVATCVLGIGRQLGLSKSFLRAVAEGALLHDVGETLLPPEMCGDRQHPRLGVGLLRAHGPLARATAQAIESHHERLDGSGFPFGLAGDAVPLAARLVALVDRYDELTCGAAGAERLSSAVSLDTLGLQSGTLDATLLGELVALMARRDDPW